MGNNDSAERRREPETNPSLEAKTNLSPASAGPTTALVSSLGSVPIKSSVVIQEDTGGRGTETATSVKGPATAFGTVTLVDDSSDSKGGIFPAREEQEVVPAAPAPTAAVGEVSGGAIVSAVVDNLSLGNKGETLAVVDEKGATAGSSQDLRLEENSAVGVAVGDEESKDLSKEEPVGTHEKDELLADGAGVAAAGRDPAADAQLQAEPVKVELNYVPAEIVEGYYSAADDKVLTKPLEAESKPLHSERTELNDSINPDGVSPVAEVEKIAGAATTTDYGAVNEKALSQPLEAESSALESAKMETIDGTDPDGNVHLEESEEIEAEFSPIKAEGSGAVEIDDPETAEVRLGTGDADHDEALEAGSKILEPAVAEGTGDVLANKADNFEASLALQSVEKDNLESDSSLIPAEKLGGVHDSKSSDKNAVVEGNIKVEKVGNQSQNLHTGSEDNGNLYRREIENKVSEDLDLKEDGTLRPIPDQEVKSAADGSQATDYDDGNMALAKTKEEKKEGLVSHGPNGVAIIEGTEAAKQVIKEIMEGSSETNENSDYTHSVDGQIVTDSDEEVETDEEDDGKELFDSATLAALLRAATGSSVDGNITLSSQDSGRIFTIDRPAGLGPSIPSLKPAPARSIRPPVFTPSELELVREEESHMNEEDKKLYEKVEHIRVKFLRLVQRLKQSPEDTVAAQVLYRLGLAEGIRNGRQNRLTFNLENAKRKALQLESEGKDDLDFSCNILVIGKTGVGKSATINSIFGEERTRVDAFEATTISVKEISGIVDGVKIRVIDTPGLKASAMEQSSNKKILSAIKKYTKKCPPDIVLYVDRLDTQTRDLNDLPLLRSITSMLGSSIWFNAIVALTHAASAPPDGPNGSPLSYEVFLAQRSHVVQHSIRQGAGDMRLMNPVALVENHPSCRRNKDGERVLPNGISWRLQMLLLCYSSKILSEANSLLKLRDPSSGNLFRSHSPPLPVFLSSLLQSRVHPRLSADQGGVNGDSDLEVDAFSDGEEQDDDEYDQLPPFKPLKKAQIAKLTKEQRKAYYEEYDYRVKLLQKKQWKEEIRRMKEMKKREKSVEDDFGYGDMAEDDQDAAPAAVPVPLPDMVLPQSFDCDNPVYRYRFLEPTSQLLTRPVLDTHSWDHDCGYDGVSIEHNLALVGCFPAGVAAQITKDKKDFSIHLDSSICMKHGKNGSTLACFDIQPVGRQLAYTLRGETEFKNLKKNNTTGGISVTFLGETVATGLKVEDHISIGKRLAFVASTGAVRAQGDMAYGANLEARLRDKDFPIGQALTTLGLSLLRWRGDLALGANVQSQFSVGRNSKMAIRVGLNNKLNGQITVKTSTSEQLQIALLGILPIAISIFRSILSGQSYSAH